MTPIAPLRPVQPFVRRADACRELHRREFDRRELVSRELDRRELDGPRLVFAICTIARSGSTWLSQLVASTELLGNPTEYMLGWPQWCVRLGLSRSTPFEEYVWHLLRQRSTANGVFAIKGSVVEMQPFLRLFPGAPCVWLSRENKLEQAVSWHRANVTGLWHRSDPNLPPPAFEFHVDAALACYDEILRRESLWRAFFAGRQTPPLLLTYEEVCRDPLAAVRSIADYVGVDERRIGRVASPLKITRSDDTAQWVRLTEQALAQRDQNRAAPERRFV